jgi:tripartite-type tricarboxylate transporter receptor subunit TctC
MRLLAALSFCVVCALVPFTASAQNFPSKPIRILVPFPPGGTPDTLARVLANRATQLVKQQVIVENRPGAGGNVAMELAARANPDGYTLIMGTIGTCSLNPFLYDSIGFNVERDFAPLMLVGSISNLLVVHPSVPANSVKELVALAKSKAGDLTYGSSGFGSSLHLSMELFKTAAGVDIRHVPYKGSALADAAIVANEVSVMFDNMPSILPSAQAGKVRPLAVTGSKRSKMFPNVPTMQEAGYPTVVVAPWFGLLAPAKTPPTVMSKLNAVFNEAMQDETVRKRFAEIDLEPGNGSPAEFGKLIRAESDKWGKLIKEKNIKAE